MGDDTSQKAVTDTTATAPASEPKETWEQRLERIKIFDREKVSGQYCGFLDILGFGAATQSDLPAVLTKYEELLDKAEWLQSTRPKVRVSVYSDSFVLVSSQLAPLISAAQTLQWFLLLEDCIVRGGVAYGDHAEGERNGIRFTVSAGLSKAVGVEKSIKWPCVAIHPDLEMPDEFWVQETRPLLYFDGIRMVESVQQVLVPVREPACEEAREAIPRARREVRVVFAAVRSRQGGPPSTSVCVRTTEGEVSGTRR
jgi:hypothetical protein